MDVGENMTTETPGGMRFGEVADWHRYRWAAELLSGRRVVELCCGAGWGARLMVEGGVESVVGVDRDPSQAERAAVASRDGSRLRFEAAATLEFLRGGEVSAFDGLVWFRALGSGELLEALGPLRDLAGAGARMLLSPQVDEAQLERLLDGFPEPVVLRHSTLDASIIAPVGLSAGETAPSAPVDPGQPGRLLVAVNLGTPAASSHVEVIPLSRARELARLERANAELRHTNARLARERIGSFDSAAAAQAARLQDALTAVRREQDHARELGAQVEDLRHRLAALRAPRHQMVDALRDRVLAVPLVGRVAKLAWRMAKYLRGP